MKTEKIEHIGIAVRSIENAKKFYEDVLGLNCYLVEEVPDQKVITAFYMIGGTKIELLESTDPEGPVARFIEKRGEGIHHIAYAVDNVEDALENAAAAGMELIDKKPRPGAEGMSIAFLHPKSASGVLTEFCSKKS